MADAKTILIVDDDEANLEFLGAYLELEGYEVMTARDGAQALEQLRRQQPELVISDILMPNMDGYQLCRRLKADPDISEIPLIFYSATYTDQADQEFALDLGAAKFLVKPQEPVELHKNILEVLNRSEESGHPTDVLIKDEENYLSRYSQRLVVKLEQKLAQLAKLNSELREEMMLKEKAEAEISRLAYSDLLTGLSNRTFLLTRTAEIVDNARSSGRRLAMLVIDIDYFREFYHTLGRRLGNLLICQVATRLSDAVHDEQCLLARVGGDEFALLLEPLIDDQHLSSVVEKLHRAFDAPFDVDGVPAGLTAAIGVAVFPEHGDEGPILLRNAEVAMRCAKTTGQSECSYQSETDPFRPRRLSLLAGIKQAIEQDQLVLHYQPVVSLETDTVVGAEALVRWEHPEYGMLAPDAFIGLAEQTGQIRNLTRWLFGVGLHQLGEWREQSFDLSLSINLSVRNLLEDDLPDRLSEVLAEEGIDDPKLTLEITESALLQDPHRAQRTLQRLADLGARVAIDDFGTGYSSLSHLRLFPVGELKIDKSFVINMMTNDHDAVIVRSMIQLAHNLGFKATAEGVESQAICDRVGELECDLAQGYFIGRPMVASDFGIWLDRVVGKGRAVSDQGSFGD